MELFTLGADRGAYSEEDVRELARSLTGWTTTGARSSASTTSAGTKATAGTHHKTVFGKTARWTWKDAARMVVEHDKTRRSSSPSSGATSSRRRPTPPRRRSWRRSTRARAMRSGRCLEAILCAPQLYDGPRMVKPPTVLVAGMLRARGRAITDKPGAGSSRAPASASTTRRTWRAGTTSAGWTRTPRWAAGRPSTTCSTGGTRTRGGRRLQARDRRKAAVAKARAFWGDPDLTAASVKALQDFARSAIPSDGVPPQALAAPERAAPAARRLPRLPDELRAMACHCNDYSRRGPGRPRPARHRAGHAHAGRHRPQPPLSSPARRARAVGLRRHAALAARVRGGHRGRRRLLLARADLDLPSGGLDSLSVLAPIGDSRYASLRPNLGLAPSGNANDVFTEDSSCTGTPAPRRCATCTAPARSPCIPAVGYADANQSHFTSRHYWEGGRSIRSGASAGSGATSTSTALNDNPLQGLSLDWNLAPALATTDKPVAAVSSPEYFSLGARDVWDATLRTRLDEGLEAQGGLATERPRARRRPRAAKQTVGLQRPARAAAAGQTRHGSRGRLPERERLRAAARGAGRDARRGPAAEGRRARRQRRLRHARQPERLAARRPRRVLASLAAFQADLEARGLADRVLINVWSEFGRRPQENGSGTDHGAAGLSMVIGTKAKGTMVSEFPGLCDARRGRQSRHTTDFRSVYCSLLEQWC